MWSNLYSIWSYLCDQSVFNTYSLFTLNWDLWRYFNILLLSSIHKSNWKSTTLYIIYWNTETFSKTSIIILYSHLIWFAQVFPSSGVIPFTVSFHIICVHINTAAAETLSN